MNWDLAYDALLAEARASSESVTDWLRKELPHAFHDAYLRMSPRPANILVFTHGTFDYIYDHFDGLPEAESNPSGAISESRLVAAYGVSCINRTRRAHDDGRLRGWAGTPSTAFGPGWDKGHFIAHAIGGAVDGVEANVFLQRRSINRGGYRRMEQYCAEHAGVLCFSRPLYDDLTSRPAAVEFGVLKPEMTWWVQRFSNR